MTDDTNFTIKLPQQFYVGLRAQGEDELPLGFATPYEPTLKAYEKRKATVDSWTRQYNYEWDPVQRKNVEKPGIEPKLIDNVPLPGFKIAESVRRVYWGGGNVVWRIEDPRGFELEISSSNLARIIDCATIENGVITVDCVWGRDKAQNVLLPITSEPYKQATENTDRLSKKVALKDVTIGDKVLLKNGEEGVYAGAFNVLVYDVKEKTRSRYGEEPTTIKLFNVRRRYAIRRELTEEDLKQWRYNDSKFKVDDPEYTFVSELSVSKILEKTEQPKNYLVEIQQFVESTKTMWRTGLDNAFYITDKPIKEGTIKPAFLPVELEELVGMINKYKSKDYGTQGPMYLVENNKKIHINRAYDRSNSGIARCTVHTTPITFVDQFTISYVPVHRYAYDYYSSTDADIVIPQWHTEGKITKLAFNIDGVDYIPEGYF